LYITKLNTNGQMLMRRRDHSLRLFILSTVRLGLSENGADHKRPIFTVVSYSYCPISSNCRKTYNSCVRSQPTQKVPIFSWVSSMCSRNQFVPLFDSRSPKSLGTWLKSLCPPGSSSFSLAQRWDPQRWILHYILITYLYYILCLCLY
jgi:hypothetical protein